MKKTWNKSMLIIIALFVVVMMTIYDLALIGIIISKCSIGEGFYLFAMMSWCLIFMWWLNKKFLKLKEEKDLMS